MRERTNRESYPSKKHQEADGSTHPFVTCSRIHQGGITKTITKKSPKKPINRVCPGEESTDEHIHRVGQGRLMVHKEYYMEILPGNGFPIVKSTWFGLTSWGPVTEARPLPVHGSTPGTCHCLQYQSSWSEVVFNKTCILCGGVIPFNKKPLL